MLRTAVTLRIVAIRLTAALLPAAAIILTGCASDSESTRETKSRSTETATTEIERGPVRVLVEVDPNPARLSDTPTLTLTIDYQRGVEIKKPPFGESLGDFLIRDFQEPLPASDGDREIVKQIYTLEPVRSGELQIDPIVIHFRDARTEGDGRDHQIETEALTIDVESVVATEAPTLDDLAGPASPVPLPRQPVSVWWWIAPIFAAVFCAGIGFWWVRRNRETISQPQLSPQELAYLELEKLLEAGLGETDVKLFYVELTGIVRRYIERTTHIHAPEQTTEEFLREISTGNVFSSEDQRRLKSFLESADLVKFAAHQPTPKDVEQTFQRAKKFIGLAEQGVAA